MSQDNLVGHQNNSLIWLRLKPVITCAYMIGQLETWNMGVVARITNLEFLHSLFLYIEKRLIDPLWYGKLQLVNNLDNIYLTFFL